MNKFYEACQICPHQCGVDRTQGLTGFCQAPARPKIAKTMLHLWEEPCLSGTSGSGAVFFSHCNLGCIFCQNYTISHQGAGFELSTGQLAEKFLELQAQGAHNINLVSPSPYIPSLAIALTDAKKSGLVIPVIYNTNAYEFPEIIDELKGLIDIYLPDLKYFYHETSRELAGVSDYFERASAAIIRMFEHAGPTQIGASGLMEKGLLIRHLVLPDYLEDSKCILKWIRVNLPKEVYISLMSQYFPAYRAKKHPRINRALTGEEYDAMIDYFFDIGLENGFMQELSSATDDFVPDFLG